MWKCALVISVQLLISIMNEFSSHLAEFNQIDSQWFRWLTSPCELRLHSATVCSILRSETRPDSISNWIRVQSIPSSSSSSSRGKRTRSSLLIKDKEITKHMKMRTGKGKVRGKRWWLREGKGKGTSHSLAQISRWGSAWHRSDRGMERNESDDDEEEEVSMKREGR